MTQATKLTEPRVEVLKYILDHAGQVIGFQKIADARETGHEAARRLCERMEDDGLLTISRHAQGSMIEFTDSGRQLAIEVGYGPDDVGTGGPSGGGAVVRRLHGVSVHLRIRNRGDLPDRWRRRLAERDDLDWIRVEDYEAGSDAYIAARKRWVIRFHRSSVTLQMRKGDGVERFSTAEAFRALTERIRDGVRWVREMTGAQVDMKDVEISRAECAYEQHHLAVLVDELPGLRLSDIRVQERDSDRTVIKTDGSVGPELETLTGDRAEEIGETIEDELRQYARHPAAVQWRHTFEREALVQGVDPVDAVRRLRQLGDDEGGGNGGHGDGPGPGGGSGQYYDDEMRNAMREAGMT